MRGKLQHSALCSFSPLCPVIQRRQEHSSAQKAVRASRLGLYEQAPPQGDVLVHQDIGCSLRGELSGSDGEHVGPTTEAIGQQQDVFASWCDWKEAEIINTDGDI